MVIRIIWVVIWVMIIAFVVHRAADLGRSQLLWGIFAAILPFVALIIILFLKHKKEDV